MGEKKVKVAIFDADLRIKIEKHPISKNGRQIDIRSGGTEHFMPKFDRNCGLLFPRFKKYLLFGERQHEPLYIVMRKGKKCVDFSLKDPQGEYPSPEELDQAIKALLATKIGTQGITIPWYFSVMLFLVFVFDIIIMAVLGVF